MSVSQHKVEYLYHILQLKILFQFDFPKNNLFTAICIRNVQNIVFANYRRIRKLTVTGFGAQYFRKTASVVGRNRKRQRMTHTPIHIDGVIYEPQPARRIRIAVHPAVVVRNSCSVRLFPRQPAVFGTASVQRTFI